MVQLPVLEYQLLSCTLPDTHLEVASKNNFPRRNLSADQLVLNFQGRKDLNCHPQNRWDIGLELTRTLGIVPFRLCQFLVGPNDFLR